MPRPYNAFAGQNLERLAALSDGVFAVAMTLLVLDLRTPAIEAIHSEGDLRHALLALAPRLAVYLMSFLTLGIFWIGQQTQLHRLTRSDRDLAWLNLAFLFLVTLMPFSTSLIAEFITYRTALLLYWVNILLLGVAVFATWRYARRAGLTADEVTVEFARAVERRVIIGQSLYALGALLCVFSTYWSLGFIVLVQLNYAIAPRLKWLWRL
jgi:uncharacterized membrane protein